MRLIIVRHGLSSFNLEKRIQGRNDLSSLTKEGENQAIQAGKALSDLNINSIYSSPLQRAASTTNQIINQYKDKLSPIFDEGLLEVDLGPWSGLTSKEVEENFPESFEVWKEDPQKLILQKETGSSYKPIEELITQARLFLDKLLDKHLSKDNQNIILVGHNAIIRCLILELLKRPSKGFKRIRIDNASISIFNININSEGGYKVQLECLNSSAHLDKKIPKKPKESARVILVRHGETDWNKQGRFQGQIDIPLNKNGISQANAAGEFLKNETINKFYSSSMKRPIETAQEINKFHSSSELISKNGLIEISHGLWEGKLDSEIQSNWPELLEEWKQSPEKVQMPEGENINDVWERSFNTWLEIRNSLAPKETALVVAHDAVNKTILCNLLGLSSADIWMIKQGNGGITIIDISVDPTQPDVITCLNLTSHLGGLIDQTAAGAL